MSYFRESCCADCAQGKPAPQGGVLLKSPKESLRSPIVLGLLAAGVRWAYLKSKGKDASFW